MITPLKPWRKLVIEADLHRGYFRPYENKLSVAITPTVINRTSTPLIKPVRHAHKEHNGTSVIRTHYQGCFFELQHVPLYYCLPKIKNKKDVRFRLSGTSRNQILIRGQEHSRDATFSRR